MPPRDPEEQIVPLVIEGTEEGIRSVRKAVYDAIGELPLAQGTRNSPIHFMLRDIHRIIQLAASIDGARLNGTPEDGYVLRLKSMEATPTLQIQPVQIPPRAVAPVVERQVQPPVNEDSVEEEIDQDRTYVRLDEWERMRPRLTPDEKTAKDLANVVNEAIARRLHIPGLRNENRIHVEHEQYYYLRESISIYVRDAQTGQQRLMTRRELEKWRSGIRKEKKGNRRWRY